MRIGQIVLVVLLAANPSGQDSARTAHAAAPATQAVTPVQTLATQATVATDPCAAPQLAARNAVRLQVSNADRAAQFIPQPTQPLHNMQQLDPVRANEAGWSEAGDAVMALLEKAHPLTNEEKREIAIFDFGRSRRDRFYHRLDLLRQVVGVEP